MLVADCALLSGSGAWAAAHIAACLLCISCCCSPELQWARLKWEAVEVSFLSFREVVRDDQVGDPVPILAIVTYAAISPLEDVEKA